MLKGRGKADEKVSPADGRLVLALRERSGLVWNAQAKVLRRNGMEKTETVSLASAAGTPRINSPLSE